MILYTKSHFGAIFGPTCMYKKLCNFRTVPPGVTNLVSKCAGNSKEKSHKVSRRELCTLQSNRAKCPPSLFRVKWKVCTILKQHTVRAEIFAVVLFSRISRVKPSRKFPLQFMSIYSNDNISKIAKLTTRELPHLAKTAKITVRENNGVYSNANEFKYKMWMGITKRMLLKNQG